MSNEKICQNCGAKNQPYAAICADCGSSFIPPAESPPPVTPPTAPAEEPLKEGLLYEGPLEPSPRFKKRYVIYAMLAVLSLFVVIGAISASYQMANRLSAAPSIEASVVATAAPTGSSTASATPKPSTSISPSPSPSVPDYATRLNTIGIGAGFTTVSPFEKVTVNGKTAYAGILSKNGQTYNTQVYTTNTYSEALTLKDQLVISFQSQGYTTYNPGDVGDTNLNTWYGLLGNKLVSVTAMPTSQIDTPLVLVMTPT